MNELEQKLGAVLTALNNAFDVQIAESTGEDDDVIATKLEIKELRNDGSDFIEKFCELFGPIIEQASDGAKNIVYEEGTGLAIRRID